MKTLEKELIEYFKSLGIEVYTNTKARGHQGFFLKNRIDISKNIKKERIVSTLLHEFAHYIHNKLESDVNKTGGKLQILFLSTQVEIIEKELLRITNFVDENSHLTKLYERKERIKQKIITQENIIKQDYPEFMRSKKFKDFEKYIKKSKAKYLLRYDRVKFITPFLRKEEFYSIDNMEHDFPDMQKAFCAYIRLRSNTRKQARNSARINKYNKYYAKPTELFARLVECLYVDKAQALALAPYTAKIFLDLLEEGYYFELKEVFKMLQKEENLAIF